MKKFENIKYLFSVMVYYAIEAIIVGLFIAIIWKLILSKYFGNLDYLQIVSLYWIFKMIFFDVFKLISGYIPPISNDDDQ